MLKKISDNPRNYESDTPHEDFKRFEDHMTRLVKVPPQSSQERPMRACPLWW